MNQTAEMFPEIDLEPLSKRAKMLAGTWFGMMVPGRSSGVTLHLQESRPTPATQAALDELVAAEVIGVAPFNQFGGLVYKPLVWCRDAFTWVGTIVDDPEMAEPIMEPV